MQKDTYEILLGDMNALRWVPTSGKLTISSLGYRPVDGGRDTDGTILYVVRAQHKGCYHPGKASERLKGMQRSSILSAGQIAKSLFRGLHSLRWR